MNKTKNILLSIAVVLVAALLFVAVYIIRQNAGDSESDSASGTAISVPEADLDSAVKIHLEQGGSTCDDSGVTIEEDKIIINKAGTYALEGSLTDGKVEVAASEAQVVLLLNGVSIKNPNGKAIDVDDAQLTSIQTLADTENTLQGGEGEPDEVSGAAISAYSDLALSGQGKLTVLGYRKHAIKSEKSILISSGDYVLEANEDGIHADDSLELQEANIEIKAGDDAVHADSSLTVSGGELKITEAEEGLESNQISVTGGNISITSSDDGMNAFGGKNNMGGGPGRLLDEENQKENADEDLPEPNLNISGGEIYINAEGDGIDSNGNLNISGGQIFVDGPTNGGNGALDSGSENGGEIAITGGTVLAAGASGMAETFDDTSKQYSFQVALSENYQSGDTVTITDGDGKEIYSHELGKTGNNIVFSSPDLKEGASYTVKVGDQEETITQDSISVADESSNTMGMGGGHPGRQGGGFGQRPQGDFREFQETNS
ncbi:MAG: carbohydrate-binding domain-containing protein [Eubacterium sp.]|nr:carbohydrate-binding domain-containing protein [Eubacterium sp.]